MITAAFFLLRQSLITVPVQYTMHKKTSSLSVFCEAEVDSLDGTHHERGATAAAYFVLCTENHVTTRTSTTTTILRQQATAQASAKEGGCKNYVFQCFGTFRRQKPMHTTPSYVA